MLQKDGYSMKRNCEMTSLELEAELARLLKDKQAAIADGMASQADMLGRKYDMALCYTMSPERFVPGTYRVAGLDQLFTLEYLNGVMAWGRLADDTEASFPISLLEKHN